jgi:hypothetical protein
MQNAVMKHAGLMTLDCNVVMRHLDARGNVKPIFQENKLAVTLIDKGYLSPRWINSFIGRIVSHTRILGYWSNEKDAHNLITTVGNAAVAGMINGVGGVATFASIGQGTGVSAAAIGDTTLGTEVTAGGAGASGVHVIAAATASLVTTTGTNDTAQFVGTVSETATIAVTESGVFNATTNGTLLCHQVFTAVNVVSGDSLQFTWKIKVA